MSSVDAGSAKLRGLVRLSLLDRVDPALLLRFLAPHAPYLESRGVSFDTPPDQAWIGHLFDVLTSVDSEMPGTLIKSLLEIANIANETGHEFVMALAGQQQLTLFEGEPMSPEDAAFTLFLEQAEFFRDSQSQVKSQQARSFVDFLGQPGSVPQNVNARRHTLVQLLRGWFQQRNRTDHVEMRVQQREDETTFVVIHGQTPRSVGVIVDRDRRERTSLIPDRADVIVLHHESGRLSVNAQYANEQDHYRKLWGGVFFEDPDYFKTTDVVTGAPLLADPAAALSVRGFHELREVRLRLAVITSLENAKRQQVLKDEDLLDVMLQGPKLFFDDDAEVTRFELELDVKRRQRPLILRAAAPNKLTYDRRQYEDLVREFLITRGFIRLSSGRPMKKEVS